MAPADATTTETLAGFVQQYAQHNPDGIAIRYGPLALPFLRAGYEFGTDPTAIVADR
jgi:hypothetical protein